MNSSLSKGKAMKTIYKYDTGHIQLPKGAKILKAGMQGGEVKIWAEVDSSQPTEERRVFVYGTGHLIPENACYIDTVFDTLFVWHVYEVL